MMTQGSVDTDANSGIPEPSGWEDPVTGLDGPDFWRRVLVAEVARSARYKRNLTVVAVELVGIEELATLWGLDVARHTLREAAQGVRRTSRTSDYCTRIGPARLGVVLTETDEIAAINFVERMRDAVDGQLQSVAPGARVAVGWAEISTSRDGRRALDHAFGRLLGDVGADADGTVDGRTDEPPDGEAPATSTDDAEPLIDLAQFREHIEAPRGGGRHDPYWELEGQAVRRRRQARRAIRATVRVLGAVILAMLLVRLAQVDASAVLVGPHRPLVFVASAADAVACCLVFAHQARRTRGFMAPTRPTTG